MSSSRFTAKTATEFERYSQTNAEILKATAALKGCNCQPYGDWLTYNRWQGINMQVQKGQQPSVPIMVRQLARQV
jgi:hypothetical protein